MAYAPMAQAAMSAKSKAFMVMCAYGTVGGALLGFASMAYGTNTRAIAQGASLGLYTGIIFGGYIIMSHQPGAKADEQLEPVQQQPYGGQPQGPPPGSMSPWGGGEQGAGAGQMQPADNNGSFFGGPQRIHELGQKAYQEFQGTTNKRVIPLYVPLMNYSF